MNLFVAGCSFSFGHKQFMEDYVWPNLCKKDFDKVINTSLCGSNNLRSLRNFLQYVQETNYDKETVYVLQLTDMHRGSYYDEDLKVWINFIKENIFLEPDSIYYKDENIDKILIIESAFKNRVLPFNVFYRNREYCELETLQIINTFISICKKYNLKYLITGMSLSCFLPDDKISHIIDTDNFIEPISKLTVGNTLKDADDDADSHPNSKGHEIFYRYIISEIEKRWQI